jgi:Class III cytochrome C family
MTPWRRAATACGLLTALLLVPLPASGGMAWDLAAVLGYAAIVFALLLFLYPLRRPGLPHRLLFTITQHRRLGWLALILAVLHTLLLLRIEPDTGYYLLPSAPLYMLCGTAALITLAVLLQTGLRVRRLMRLATRDRSQPAPRRTSLTHATLSAVLLALIGVHVIGSGQLLDRSSKAVLACVLLALALCWSVLKPRWQWLRTRWFPVVLPGVLAVVVLLALTMPTARSRLLEPLRSSDPALPLTFPHDAHREVNCLLCHHNWVDHTGAGSCISCHREPAVAGRRSAAAIFHVFCRDCHTELAQQGHKHGPTRSCGTCHREAGRWPEGGRESTGAGGSTEAVDPVP